MSADDSLALFVFLMRVRPRGDSRISKGGPLSRLKFTHASSPIV